MMTMKWRREKKMMMKKKMKMVRLLMMPITRKIISNNKTHRLKITQWSNLKKQKIFQSKYRMIVVISKLLKILINHKICLGCLQMKMEAKIIIMKLVDMQTLTIQRMKRTKGRKLRDKITKVRRKQIINRQIRIQILVITILICRKKRNERTVIDQQNNKIELNI